jgi:hypothetical protein
MCNNNDLNDYCVTRFIFDIELNNVVIELTATFPPYSSCTMICNEVIALRFNRTDDTQPPYFCGKFVWKNCGTNIDKILLDIQYPFYKNLPISSSNLIIPTCDCFYLQFEGNLCGDIVCKKIEKMES